MSINSFGDKVFEIWDEMPPGIRISVAFLNEETLLLVTGGASNCVCGTSTTLVNNNEKNTSITMTPHLVIGPLAIRVIT